MLKEDNNYTGIENLDTLMSRLKSLSVAHTKYTSDWIKYSLKILNYAELPIDNLHLAPSIYRKLKAIGIETIGDLILKKEQDLRSYKIKIGSKSICDIENTLNKIGLGLGYFS